MAIPTAEWEKACALVSASRRVVLATHAGPDGDGIGSMVGLSLALRALGKTVAMVCADPVPPDLTFVPHADEIQVLPQLAALPFAPDLIIVCDSASLERLGAVHGESQSAFAALPILNLDHHRTNERFGRVSLVDATAAATVEIVHELLERLRVEPTQEAATALMTGLVTDTVGFRTESVTPRTLTLAAQLLERGAPLEEINYRVFRATRYAKLKLWGYGLSNLQRSEDGRIVWTTLPREVRMELGAKETDLMGLASLIEGIEGADIVILAWDKRKDPLRTGISLRSRTANVAAVAQTLGGGGHAGAAGVLLTNTPLSEGLRKAVEAAKAHLD
ncbi:MAG: DHH family phosphoesterase [Chloroflexota bacterium]|nr:DHH family phosphoesterase [Chloroflexota bacterium]MDE2839767.1 DHH family phosphoesterase [Chloroflexota bacterium]